MTKEIMADDLLRTAVDAARKAGKVLMKGYNPLGVAMLQGKGHEVTRYDLESEHLIKGIIRKKYPNHNILAEESGYSKKGSEYTWFVDPLDGTRNYRRGSPFFSISISVSNGSELLMGLVYAPYMNELYSAVKGRGSYLNGKRIGVSANSELSKAFVVSCEGATGINRYSDIYAKIRSKTLDLVKLGSAAIECCWVAAGKADAYIVPEINLWDVSAGVLIVDEAGGKVTDFDGGKWQLKPSDVLASNGIIHSELVKLLKNM